jgi:multiple sugar transport system permease protein
MNLTLSQAASFKFRDRWRRLRRIGGLRQQEIVWGFLFILPNVLGFLLFNLGPMVASFGMIFTDWTVIRPPDFVGLENFQKLVRDDLFLTALLNTFYYVAGYIPLVTILAFLLSNLLDRKLRGIAIYRTVFFMPSVCMFVSIAILWQWLYSPTSGLINYFLSLFGIQGPGWLSETRWAMPAIIVMGVWRHVGYYSLIFLAGLQGIPQEYYEAAEIDGAGMWAKMRNVTIPLIFPTTFFVLVIAFIEAFQLFGEPYIMTGGGPGYATTTLVFLIYRNAFEGFKMGYASLQAWVLFAVIFLVTLIQYRLGQERGYGFE